jgi:glycosyl-4,4'-diaponeurosporenoate acyltransferase
MLIDLSVPWIIVLDVAAWLAVHMGTAWGVTQLDTSRFDPGHALFRIRGWEGNGSVYDRLFRIRRWKGLLPDGAALFAKGFRKKRIVDADQAYYERFVRETCRGELAHWLVICIAPVFFIWNYWWAGLIMIVYALAASLPFIMTQRFNRIRFLALIEQLRRMNDVEPHTNTNGERS